MPAPNLSYLLPRLARHFMPERLTRYLLLRSWIIRPGLETSAPGAAVQRYVNILQQGGESIRHKRVMLFGYGGRFDVGLGLLEAGAGHVVLCERFAPPDDAHNARFLPEYDTYLYLENGKPRPQTAFMELVRADVRDAKSFVNVPACDYVFSNSVYEHVDDVDGVTCGLARLTRPEGLQIHYVDLRDHFFKYPFEMLAYEAKTWYGWLNPSSNHNRFRLWDYREVFEKYFASVEIEILARDEPAFMQASPRVRPEFRTGNLQDDSVTLIRVIARQPRT